MSLWLGVFVAFGIICLLIFLDSGSGGGGFAL